MAYPYYPQNYPQVYPQNYPQPNYYQQQQAQAQNLQQQQTPQIQNGGFLPAPNENYVNSYPVGAGNCITFKIEGKPIVIEKSMGFSQLESPKIKRYRLVEEEQAEAIQEAPETVKPAEIEKINKDISDLWDEVNNIKSMVKKPVNSKKKVEVEDDTE